MLNEVQLYYRLRYALVRFTRRTQFLYVFIVFKVGKPFSCLYLFCLYLYLYSLFWPVNRNNLQGQVQDDIPVSLELMKLHSTQFRCRRFDLWSHQLYLTENFQIKFHYLAPLSWNHSTSSKSLVMLMNKAKMSKVVQQ